MKFLLFSIFVFCTFALKGEEKEFYYIEKKNHTIINWTKGIIYSEYTITGNSESLDKIEKETFEKALHNLYLTLYDIYFESGIKIKDKIKTDQNFKKIIHMISDNVRIEKKIKYLNTITYLLSFSFLDYFNYYFPIKNEISNFESIKLLEKDFKGILLYVPTKEIKPALRIKIYSNNGKLILTIPCKKNFYFSNTNFLNEEQKFHNPYIIYTKKTINLNDLILDQKDIEFLIGTKKLLEEDLRVIFYAEQ